MRVYKFGGTSVQDAEGVRNVANILQQESNTNLMIVVSAMGKTTNALEQVVNDYYSGGAPSLEGVKKFHLDILDALFEADDAIYNEVNNLFVEIEWVIEDTPTCRSERVNFRVFEYIFEIVGETYSDRVEIALEVFW